MIQSAAGYGNSAQTGAFPGLGQTRNGLSSPTDGQQDRPGHGSVGGRGMQPIGGILHHGYIHLQVLVLTIS
jgi:CCR4-NOT transcription complex subunit 2